MVHRVVISGLGNFFGFWWWNQEMPSLGKREANRDVMNWCLLSKAVIFYRETGLCTVEISCHSRNFQARPGGWQLYTQTSQGFKALQRG